MREEGNMVVFDVQRLQLLTFLNLQNNIKINLFILQNKIKKNLN